MKAYEIRQTTGIDAWVFTERPEPKAGPGQVLIRVRAVSLNYRDMSVTKGSYGRGLKLPLIPLSDGAGEVIELGEGVTRIKKGDRVAGIFMQSWLAGGIAEADSKSALGGAIDGMFAEYVVLHESGVVHIPDHLSYEEGATLPCAAVTAWHALIEAGQLKPGQTVLVLGTGGVSIFALQFAKLMGACVIATSSSDEKIAKVRSLGGDETINYKTTPDWEKAVKSLTNGVGVDHVVEVGGAGTLARSLKAVRAGGQVSLIGVLTGGAGEVNPVPMLMRSIRLQGIYVGSRAMFEDMNRAISLHQMRPVIDRVFAFEEARDAYGHMERGAHFGKIVVRI